jgi:NAD(H)-dependent 7beta-hydroxy-3-oxo-delta4-cholenoic acid oxidoreductase
MNFPNLLQPIKIGNMTVKNRIAMSPMSLRIANIRHADGTPSNKLINFWEARAKGGVGLIITDVLTPDPDYCYLGPTLALSTDTQIDSIRRLTDVIHKHGAKVIPQLTHPGPGSLRGLLFNKEVVGPSKGVNVQTGSPIRELSIEEIEKIIDQFGDTAKNAKKAGFDGVELHCAHSYMLLGSFLSPARNKRTDKYGGALEGRMRLPLEVIKNIKKKAGEDFPVIVRMSGDEIIEDGNHLADTICIARTFCEAGVDALEISGGSYPETPYWVMPCQGMPSAINADFASEIKKAVNIPVLCVGGIRTPDMAESLIATGKADMIVMGRALLADPEWANKSMNGDIDNICPCIGCSDGCLGPISEVHTTCVINPMVGEEKEMELVVAETPKKVVVIGGGPAGMMAARDCALRGHKVTLLEKEDHLGGLLNAASRSPFKQDVARWIKYLIHQVKSLNVDVRLSQEGNEEILKQLCPDTIIVATGGEPIIPDIPGIERDKVITALSILNGDFPILEGNVLIIGGGIVGLETAELLAQNIKPTYLTILEMLEEVGKEIYQPKLDLMLGRLKSKGVSIHMSTTVKEITENGVIASVNGNDKNFGKFDHIVVACGFRSNYDKSKYEGLAKEVFVIGDAVKPRKALEAIAEGAKIARQI